ncbi:MAG: prolyl aminopeptidase [Pseudomonadaceae bacterium]|nr:prolyl aminopeptidase [Pseudomonadaceae bacterium]
MALYPELTPFRTGHLKLTDGHSMYYEESGNPQETPVVYLHGGPGNGLSSKHRRYTDPKTTHIITYDQRGCGQSKPLHSLKANTTQHLVEDLERLRKHLKLESWFVAGFSWGATLALAYAEAYPQRVRGLVVGGVYLGTKRETAWLTHPDGVARFFPNDYAAVMEALDYPKPADVSNALLSIFKNGTKREKEQAAYAWCQLEAAACEAKLNRKELVKELEEDREILPALALLEAHYFANDCFLKPGQLLNNIYKIAHIPLHIVQGAADMVCPPETAIALHAAHPNSRLYWVEGGGHRANPPLLRARMNAIKDMLKAVKRL